MSIVGIAILIAPFLLLFFFKNKVLGFISILTASTFFHLAVALSAQYFHFFNRPNIIIISLSILTLIFLWIARNKNKTYLKIKIDIFLLIAILIIVFELFSVHYFFTGEINTITGRDYVHGASYPYPYFPDDWAGVAFTTYAIDNNNLPTTNPLIDGPDHDNFRNIFVGWFAFLAQIFLILNIAPLLGFSILTIFSGTLICWLVYLFLKSSSIRTFPALIAMLALPWITNSSKLPGIWYLFPFIGGVIFFLSALIAINLKNKYLALAAGLLSIIFYPPFFIIVGPALIAHFLSQKTDGKEKIIITAFFASGVAAVTGLIFLLQINSADQLVSFFLESLIRSNNEGGISSREIWRVVPIVLLPFFLIGLSVIKIKKMWHLGVPLFIGLAYWLVYSFSKKYFIIGYGRIAALTSYLIIITAGLGINHIIDKIVAKKSFTNNAVLASKIVIIFLFAVLALFYTRYDAWKHIKLTYQDYRGRAMDAPFDAPTNHYLHPDDLRIFKDIHKTRFLSLPWKGLTIGVATNNYPLHARASTISNFYHPYYFFSDGNCDYKKEVAETWAIKYVYLPSFDCPYFILLDKSVEGMHLYEFKP